MGRLFMIFSASQNTVVKTSSVNRVLELSIANSTRRMVRIILSQSPPWWEARGGLITHSMLRWRAARMTSIRLSWRKLRSSSFRAPTKLVPLSERTSWGCPRREMKRIRQLINASGWHRYVGKSTILLSSWPTVEALTCNTFMFDAFDHCPCSYDPVSSTQFCQDPFCTKMRVIMIIISNHGIHFVTRRQDHSELWFLWNKFLTQSATNDNQTITIQHWCQLE